MASPSTNDISYSPGHPEFDFSDALRKAVSSGDISAVHSLCSQQPQPKWLDTAKELKQTTCNMIHKAVAARDIERVRELLLDWSSDSSLSPFVPQDLAWSLSGAIEAGSKDISVLLLQHGARATGGFARQTIMKPRTYDAETFKSILDALLDYGWDDINYDEILCQGVKDKSLAEWALAKGANPNTKSSSGHSAIIRAASSGTLSTMELLFEHGALIDNNAVIAVAKRSRPDSESIPILQLLLSHGADLNAVETGLRRPSSSALRMARPHLHTALYEAVNADDAQMVEWLIEHGADPMVPIRYGKAAGPKPLDLMLKSKHASLRQAAEATRFGSNATQA